MPPAAEANVEKCFAFTNTWILQTHTHTQPSKRRTHAHTHTNRQRTAGTDMNVFGLIATCKTQLHTNRQIQLHELFKGGERDEWCGKGRPEERSFILPSPSWAVGCGRWVCV